MLWLIEKSPIWKPRHTDDVIMRFDIISADFVKSLPQAFPSIQYSSHLSSRAFWRQSRAFLDVVSQKSLASMSTVLFILLRPRSYFLVCCHPLVCVRCPDCESDFERLDWNHRGLLVRYSRPGPLLVPAWGCCESPAWCSGWPCWSVR